MGWIYVATNMVDGKQYVGQTASWRSVSLRWQEHVADSRDSRRMGWHLCRAIRKYGEDSFQIGVLEQCPDALLDCEEIYWINRLDTYGKGGLNEVRGGKPRRKLSSSQLSELKKAYLAGGHSFSSLAREFGVSERTVSDFAQSLGYKKQKVNRVGILANPPVLGVRRFASIYSCAKMLLQERNCDVSKKNIETVSRYIRHVVHHKKKRKSVYGHVFIPANDA